MTSVLALAAWSAAGVAAANWRNEDRAPAWWAAGLVLGPLWLVIRLERASLRRRSTQTATPEGR